MAQDAKVVAKVRTPVSYFPGIPTGELSPEARAALAINNPQAYADLLRWEEAQPKAQPAPAPAPPVVADKGGKH